MPDKSSSGRAKRAVERGHAKPRKNTRVGGANNKGKNKTVPYRWKGARIPPADPNPPKRAARMESSKANANVIVPIVSKKQNAPDSSVSSEENRRLAVAEKRKKAIMSTDTVHGLVPRGSTKMLDHAFYWPKHSTAKNMPGDQGEQVDDDVGGKTVPTRNNNLPWKRRATNLIMNYGIMSKGMEHAESKKDTATSAVDVPHADEHHHSEARQVTRAYEYDDFAKMHVAEERALFATSPKPKATVNRGRKRNIFSKTKRKKKIQEYRYIPDVGYVLEKDSSDDEARGDSDMANAQQQYKMPATSTLDLFRKVNGTYILHNMRKTIYANMPDYVMMGTGANVSGVTVTARARQKGRSSRGSSRSPTSSSSSQSPEWKGQKKKPQSLRKNLGGI